MNKVMKLGNVQRSILESSANKFGPAQKWFPFATPFKKTIWLPDRRSGWNERMKEGIPCEKRRYFNTEGPPFKMILQPGAGEIMRVMCSHSGHIMQPCFDFITILTILYIWIYILYIFIPLFAQQYIANLQNKWTKLSSHQGSSDWQPIYTFARMIFLVHSQIFSNILKYK